MLLHDTYMYTRETLGSCMHARPPMATTTYAYLVRGHRHRGRVLAVAAPPLSEISAYRSDFDHALNFGTFHPANIATTCNQTAVWNRAIYSIMDNIISRRYQVEFPGIQEKFPWKAVLTRKCKGYLDIYGHCSRLMARNSDLCWNLCNSLASLPPTMQLTWKLLY